MSLSYTWNTSTAPTNYNWYLIVVLHRVSMGPTNIGTE